MILLDGVTITYDGEVAPALTGVDLVIHEGELCVVVGPTGVGKSTLLGLVAGLVPHFTGGLLEGRVVVAGRDTRTTRPRDLADVVGVVAQDPAAAFVTDTVESELAFTMEQLGVPQDVMRKRVEETLDLLGIEGLRRRQLRTLSGGEQQRVAIGAVLTAHPRVLVLDEPTSALDPSGAEDVLAALARLVSDLGVTALVAEHRLERVAQFADAMVEVRRDGTVVHGSPAVIAATAAVAPPVVRLGRLAGWQPLPLSIRDARRAAVDLRERLADRRPPAARTAVAVPDGRPVLVACGLEVAHDGVTAVAGVDLALHRGEVAALMGRNGSGKSSLLWALHGAGRRDAGGVSIADADPAHLDPDAARRLVGLVPQTPSDLLYLSTVAEECAQADAESGAAAGAAASLLADIAGPIDPATHPRDLSEGQRLALALAVQLVARPAVLLLDEPTRGLDYAAKERLAHVLAHLARAGTAVLVATHDVEFVAAACARVVVLAHGEVVADGPTTDVVVSSPVFAPQVAKVLAPQRWLTVDEVAAALAPADGATRGGTRGA